MCGVVIVYRCFNHTSLERGAARFCSHPPPELHERGTIQKHWNRATIAESTLILNGHLTLPVWPISRICSRTGEFCRKVQVYQMEFTSRKVVVRITGLLLSIDSRRGYLIWAGQIGGISTSDLVCSLCTFCRKRPSRGKNVYACSLTP